jgi:peptide/nickel transport system ATP-binding protein
VTDPVVLVDDLRVSCAGRSLVDGVGFALAAGQVLAIVGASGSGKTTTGLALLGEYPPGAEVSGRVVVTGAVGFVPQHPAAVLNPVRRIGSVLAEIASPHAVADALRRARLSVNLRHYPHQLSGGQQQRLVLAQALVGNPSVIVADEPTTGQDAITRGGVVAELAAVARQGVAVVLLCHDLDVVRALADQVVVLRAGQVVEAGPADDVLTRPRHEYTRALIAAQPNPDAIRDERPDRPPRLSTVDLTARHGRTTVLHDVRVSVGAGECLAVVGRSGSGKTTLARCVAGLHPPSGGRTLLDGRPLPATVRRRSRRELATVQYVFQDARASFDHHRDVLDQVSRTAVRLRGLSPAEARAAALAALAEVGLPEHTVRRRPNGLSGGELQRAALARALLAEPRVLICDEITTGLDTLTQAGILDQLAALRRDRDLTLLLISHDLGVVARLADHVTVLDHGRVVEHR